MEYCDRATLRHAMKKGVFHKRLDNTSVAVDLCAIVQASDGAREEQGQGRHPWALDGMPSCWLSALKLDSFWASKWGGGGHASCQSMRSA